MRSVAEFTGETPPALAARPEKIATHLNAYVRAYQTLANSRASNGMTGLGPVPLSEIKAYTELFYVADVELLVRIVRELDDYFVERARDGRRKDFHTSD